MIEVLVGTHAARAKRKTPLEDLRWETMSVEEIAMLASTPSFWGDARVFVLEGALTGERAEDFFGLIDGLQKSPHTFIFKEEKLLKKPLDLLAKKGITVEQSKEPKKDSAAKEPTNVFALANAFGARDRKKMWLLLVQALRADTAPEAIAGMLHWKVRDMLAKKTPGKFTVEELKNISRELVALYHDAHRGGGSLELLLERFVLRV